MEVPSHCLRTVGSVLGEDWRKHGSGKWWDIFTALQTNLRKAAQAVLPEEEAHKYTRLTLIELLGGSIVDQRLPKTSDG